MDIVSYQREKTGNLNAISSFYHRFNASKTLLDDRLRRVVGRFGKSSKGKETLIALLCNYAYWK